MALRTCVLFVFCSILLARQTPQPQTSIKAGILVDGKGKIIRNMHVVVLGSKISRVSEAARETHYDLSNMTVMPGWIDTHVHIGNHFDADGRAHNPVSGKDETPAQAMLYAVENAYQTLMAGFTTVQSVGAPVDKDVRDWIARGAVPGPRILTSISSINENSGTPDQIRQRVRSFKQQGADVIKIFASKSIREGSGQSMSNAQIEAACGEAKAAGLRSVVHAQGSDSARAAVLAGCTSIEHGNSLTDEVIQLMAERGAFFDPHFGLIFSNYFENKQRYLGIGNYTEAGYAMMEKAVPVGIDTFKRTLKNGKVKIVFGADAVAGANGRNYEEFLHRIRDGGQSPMDAIVSATSRAAESLGLQNMTGSVTPGLEADLIALDGNPFEDLSAFRRVVFVMKGGKVYKNVAGRK